MACWKLDKCEKLKVHNLMSFYLRKWEKQRYTTASEVAETQTLMSFSKLHTLVKYCGKVCGHKCSTILNLISECPEILSLQLYPKI
jgi:hypothetical protein